MRTSCWAFGTNASTNGRFINGCEIFKGAYPTKYEFSFVWENGKFIGTSVHVKTRSKWYEEKNRSK